MNKTIVLREGSKVEDFSLDNLLGGVAINCTFTCENIFTCAPNNCNDNNKDKYPSCQPNIRQLIEKPSGLNIELSF